MKLNRNIIYPAWIVLAWVVSSWHWLSGKKFIPWDSVDAFFPQTAFIVDTLQKGQWPVWNPLAFGGLPVLGDPQSMIFTPHVVIGLLSGSSFGLWVFDATTLLCMLLGALCLYRYARNLGSLPVFAALGAMVFMLGGYGSSRLQHVPQIVSLGLLPVLLLTFRNCVTRPSIGSTLALATTGALLALNPNHVVFLTFFLIGPLLVMDLCRCPRLRPALVSLACAAVLMGLAVAPSLAAILETITQSTRTALTLHSNDPASLPAINMLSALLPGTFGIRNGAGGYWSSIDLSESYLYIGVIPTALLIWGMMRRQAPSPVLVLIWIMGLVSLLFAMGTNAPLFPAVYENVPGFSMFRRPSDGAYFFTLYTGLAVAFSFEGEGRRVRCWPERFVVPMMVLLALIYCSLGMVEFATAKGQLNSLQEDVLHLLSRTAIATLVLLPVLVLKSRLRIVYGSAALLVLTLLDLSSAGRTTFYATDYGAHDFAEMYRVLDGWQEGEAAGVAESMRHLAARQSAGERVEIIGGSAMNLPIGLGIYTSQGYNPIKMQRYADVFGHQMLGSDPKAFTELAPSPNSEAHRFLGLRYYLLHGFILDESQQFGSFGKATIELRDSILSAGGREIPGLGTYRLFEMPVTYPRATLVAKGTSQPDEALSHCEVRFETTTGGEYVCVAPFEADMVIGDSFAPGWSACVNGHAVPVKPFLHALRSVAVPEGTSIVRTQYQPVPFLRGLIGCGG